GRARFRARAARFEGDLAMVDADQAVWRGLAEGLGFRRNTESFAQLAEALPWALAAQVARERGAVGLAGALLGTAGLIGEATLPEAHAWRVLQRTVGWRAVLRASSWERAQLRPGNGPAPRMRGLAELAARWLGHSRGSGAGPAEKLIEAVQQAA